VCSPSVRDCCNKCAVLLNVYLGIVWRLSGRCGLFRQVDQTSGDSVTIISDLQTIQTASSECIEYRAS
jgi:hypothetical protein